MYGFCCYLGGNCRTDSSQRKKCNACRMKKCVEVDSGFEGKREQGLKWNPSYGSLA